MLEQMSWRVEVLLKHSGIEVKVAAVELEPVITRFEIDLVPGVQVSQISNLAKNLARGLLVISVHDGWWRSFPASRLSDWKFPTSTAQGCLLTQSVNRCQIHAQSVSYLVSYLQADSGQGYRR